MDCYVYSCSSCGGEIIINGKEASTQCIYCGNPSVIFSRIARRKKPTYILPFKTTREYALDNIRSELKKGLFVPKQLKNFKADDVRGIYIPYWLVNVDHYGAVIVKSPVLGEPYVSPYGWSPNEGYRQVSDGLHERAGRMKIVNFRGFIYTNKKAFRMYGRLFHITYRPGKCDLQLVSELLRNSLWI